MVRRWLFIIIGILVLPSLARADLTTYRYSEALTQEDALKVQQEVEFGG